MPPKTHLPPNATLRTVVPTLDDKFTFIPAAYAVINRYEKSHGPVTLRLGTSHASKGKRPNYRIDDAKTGDYITVIDGNNHRTWPGDDLNQAGDWSTATMTYEDVKQLLLEIREQEKLPRTQT